MFDDLDLSLREMGAGDMGVGKRIKTMVRAFYGQIASYEAGLCTSGRWACAVTLVRNVYGTISPKPTQVTLLAQYFQAQDAHLACLEFAAIKSGEFNCASHKINY